MMKVKILLLAALAFAMAGCCATNSACNAPKKNIAVQMYSVRDDIKKDYDGTVKIIKDAGAKAEPRLVRRQLHPDHDCRADGPA